MADYSATPTSNVACAGFPDVIKPQGIDLFSFNYLLMAFDSAGLTIPVASPLASTGRVALLLEKRPPYPSSVGSTALSPLLQIIWSLLVILTVTRVPTVRCFVVSR
jgi:hypothetical protein